MRTGIVWDERYMWHDTGTSASIVPAGGFVQPGEPAEHPETKRRLRNLLEVSGLAARLVPVPPREATEAECLRFHTRAYLDRLAELSAGEGGVAGPYTRLGPGGYGIARLSAGGVLAAIDAVLDGRVDNAYALVRPPGHHAVRDSAMGFCLLGNVALGAHHAREARGLERVAVVDWDVHHGNGTQQAFWSDPSVLTLSVHQDRCFPPDSGGLEENGEGAGAGAALNVPLPPGSGVGAYTAVFERVVLPALERFRPDLLLVPCGFDAGAMDPLGRNLMHSEGYRALTRMLLEAAGRLCGGRVVLAHEGGYAAASVPFMGLAVLEELSGERTPVEDPFLDFMAGLGGQELQPHQERVIARAEALIAKIP